MLIKFVREGFSDLIHQTQIRKKYWDLETYRKVRKEFTLLLKMTNNSVSASKDWELNMIENDTL